MKTTTKLSELSMLSTPILTDLAAINFAQWLWASPYQYHLDDCPVGCGFPVQIANLLSARVTECKAILGSVRLWNVYYKA